MYEVNKNVEKIIMGKETNFLDYNMQELVKRKLGKISYNIYKPYQDSEKVIYYTEDLLQEETYNCYVKLTYYPIFLINLSFDLL